MRTREDLGSPPARVVSALPVKAQAKPQLPRRVALQISTAPSTLHEPGLKILRAGSFGCMWFSKLVKSNYIAPRTLLLLRRVATEGPKLKPCICSGLGQR